MSLSTLRFSTLLHNGPAAHQDHCGRYWIRTRDLCQWATNEPPHLQWGMMCNTACSVLRVSEGFVSSLREVTMLSHPQAASSQTWLSGTCLTCPPSPSTRRAPRCRLPGRRCQPPPQLSCKIKNKNNVWLLFYSILCFIPKRPTQNTSGLIQILQFVCNSKKRIWQYFQFEEFYTFYVLL